LAQGGETLKIGSLAPERDFTYVKDTVQAFLALAESEEAVGEVTNVGSGKELTIAELLYQCCEIAGHHPNVETDHARVRPEKSEVMRLLCDNTKAARIAGWKPKTSLQDGLKDTLAFIRESQSIPHPERYNI
jgi:nucleoside-diphosphate-sugar epimerase